MKKTFKFFGKDTTGFGPGLRYTADPKGEVDIFEEDLEDPTIQEYITSKLLVPVVTGDMHDEPPPPADPEPTSPPEPPPPAADPEPPADPAAIDPNAIPGDPEALGGDPGEPGAPPDAPPATEG
jgi:hypothetical protein